MEFIDVLDENGNYTGNVKSREIVHKYGDWHKVIQIFVINGNKIVLQQRALTKKSEPGKWCASASGHIGAGETSFLAAKREFEEELGIKLEKDKIRLIETFKSPSETFNNGEKIYNNHFVDLFISTQTIDIEKVKIQKEELEQLKFYDLGEFKKMVELRDERLTNTPILFDHLIIAINSLRNDKNKF